MRRLSKRKLEFAGRSIAAMPLAAHRVRNSTFVIAGVALVATAALAGGMVLTNRIVPTEMPRAPASVATLSLRVNGPVDASLAGPIVALRTGMFRDQGLRLEMTSDDSDAAVVAKVSAGTDAIGLVRSDTFLMAREHGVPIVAFAAGYLETPVVFIASGGGTISHPYDFIGKRVGYQTEADSTFVYEGLLAKLEIPRNRVIETPASNEPTALLNGQLDVWPGRLGDGVALRCPAVRPCNVIRPADYGLHIPGSVYFSSEAMLRERPEDVRRFLRGVVAGWDAAFSGSKQVRQAIESSVTLPANTSLTMSLVEQQTAIRPLGSRFGEFDEEGWRTLRQLLINSKMLGVPVDLTKAVTYGFLAEVYRQPLSGNF